MVDEVIDRWIFAMCRDTICGSRPTTNPSIIPTGSIGGGGGGRPIVSLITNARFASADCCLKSMPIVCNGMYSAYKRGNIVVGAIW